LAAERGTVTSLPVDMMIRSRNLFIFSLTLLATTVLCRTMVRAAEHAEKLSADPKIAAALRQISAQRIQADIEKLVSFQTRLTLSAQDPESIKAGHGIGAAREWIKGEFESYSRDCGGCLDVKTDGFTEGPVDRIP